MIASAKDIAPSNKEYDICIIGSGAAGLTLAKEFLDSSFTVVVLESGTFGKSPQPDLLYTIESANLPIASNSRIRAFGGTTEIWSGRWKALDPVDFAKRNWVEHSGWPVTYDDMLPYYKRASRLFGIQDSPANGASMPPLTDSPLEYSPFQFQAKNIRQWGTTLRQELEISKNISVYLDAPVVGIKAYAGGIQNVLVKANADSTYDVTAKYFIVACGGIENARLLLHSDLGNGYDQVGRYYMDHPKGACGTLEGYHSLPLARSAYFDQPRTSYALRLSDEFQKEKGILNSNIYLEGLTDRSPIGRIAGLLLTKNKYSSPVARLRNYLEQAPNPLNRITLGTTKDAFGIPVARVEWTVGEQDKKTIIAFHKLLQREMPRLRIGEVDTPLIETSKEFPITQDASHHIGTTRMGNDPHTSVVDVNCKVHSIDNLYIAGSSVFPTGGSAGPTATIAALAIRLADHLKTLL